jgi:MoaA/NifB/PqqE/SkfB family radical SAM enzyme
MNVTIRSISRYLKYFQLLKVILIKKPHLILRLLTNYFRIFVLKEKVVRKVEIGITFDCQCDCAKCSSFYMKDNDKEKLSLAEIEKTAKDIIALGAVQINLTGGEPLMEKNIYEIIKCFQPEKTLITVNTNGILLSKETIDRLETAGVDIIKISIDSPIEEEHDKSRESEGCFRHVMEALEYIKTKKRILAQLSTVCIKGNMNSGRIWKIIEMAKKYNAILGLTIPAASGRWMGEKDILLEEREREMLKKLIKIPHVIRDTDEAYARSHCPAGSEEFYLTCYGDIIPCPLIQISFGNVRDENVKEIWKKMNDFKGFKDKDKPGCLAGENKEFIEKYLATLKEHKILPVSIGDHPETKK